MNNASSLPAAHWCHPVLETVSFFKLEHQRHYDNLFVFIIVLNALYASFGMVCNTVVIFTIIKTSSLHTPSNILIIGLALSDLAVSVLSQPSYSVMKYSEYTRDFALFCSVGIVYKASIWVLASVSFFTLTAITADRFLAIQLHLRYQELVTVQRYSIVVVVIWICATGISLCRLMADNLATQIIGFIVTIAVLVSNLYFLLRINQVLRRHKNQIRNQNRQSHFLNMPKYKKSVNTIYHIIGAFLACYLPFVAALIVHFLSAEKSNYQILTYFGFSETCLMANGVVNPVIYFWKNQELRQAVKRLFLVENRMMQPHTNSIGIGNN